MRIDWKAGLGILVSVLLLRWVFRGEDLAAILHHVATANPLLLSQRARRPPPAGSSARSAGACSWIRWASPPTRPGRHHLPERHAVHLARRVRRPHGGAVSSIDGGPDVGGL